MLPLVSSVPGGLLPQVGASVVGQGVDMSRNEILRDLAIANRILAREGVVDAYGHVSLRNPERPDRFFLSRSRSPELVTPADIMEFGLDGQVVDKADTRQPYLERFIHSAVYEARPEVNSVVHNHSTAIVPFSVTKMRLRPLIHTAGGIGAHIPVWDINDKFGDTNLLVANMDQGRDMARILADNRVVLMRGHGCTVAGGSLQQAVIVAIYAQVNALLQLDALKLGDVKYLTDGEVRETAKLIEMSNVLTRLWDYFVSRADVKGI
jgi:ribulose-5-phosphate 4-epimerase/fuculose-1-phosphate aldolase